MSDQDRRGGVGPARRAVGRVELRFAVVVALAVLTLGAGPARAGTTPVHAGTIFPTTSTDVSSGATDKGTCSYSNPPSGTCSLRQALAFASSGDTISLRAPAPVGPYKLSLGELQVPLPVTLTGAGAGKTTIRQTGAYRVLKITSGLSPGTILSGLTITGGRLIGTPGMAGAAGTPGADGPSGAATKGGDGSDAPSSGGPGGSVFGGGIDNEGMLTLSGVVVTDNSATGGVGGAGGAGGAGGTTTGVVAHGAKGVSGGAGGAGQSGGLAQGGGISNATGASLTLFNVTLSANPARGGAGGAGGAGGHGGGISSFGTGGAGGNAGAAGDAGFGVGGGLYNAGTAAVAAVTVSGNRADGGVGGAGGAAGAGGSPGGSSGTSSSGGSGGFGIGGGIDGTLTVANATIDANTAAGAAGGAAGGGASSAGNTGGAEGGGFAAGNTSATTWFGNVTIASNSATGSPAFGGDLSAFFMGSHVHLADTVIAAGTADPGAGDCDGDVGAFVSDGFNLSNDTSGNCKLTQASDKPGTNPLLGPLHDNGGPTATMALRPGSPAIDAGNPSGCTYPGTSSVLTRDQRGLTRPKGAACDIGAFERSLPLAVTGNPSAIGPHGATVIGIVNPEQLPTTYRFQYGKTTAYGSHTAPASAGSGASGVPALARLAGLKPNTVYHYRLVATNTDGSSLPPGIDRSFKTAFGGVEIVSKKATVGSDMKAPIKLSCPANAKTRCSGTLTLTTKVKVKKNGKTTTKTLTLGKTPFAIDNGQTKSVKVKLSQAGFDRLKSKQTLTATATATAVDARGGTPRVTTGKVTLTPG